MFQNNLRKSFVVLGLCLLAGSCMKSPDYQKTEAIPHAIWDEQFAPVFKVNIEDTGIHYNTYLLLRHTNNYAYSNIWLNVGVKGPGDSVFRQTRIEVPLASLQGRWLGNGMGELFEQRRMIVLDIEAIPITDDLVAYAESGIPKLFRKKGLYTIRLQQNMRDVELPEVLQVGLRIEKGSPRVYNTPQTVPVKDSATAVL